MTTENTHVATIRNITTALKTLSGRNDLSIETVRQWVRRGRLDCVDAIPVAPNRSMYVTTYKDLRQWLEKQTRWHYKRGRPGRCVE